MSAIQPRTSKVTIYQGDYLDRIQHLERKAEAARDAAGDVRTMMDEPEYLAIAKEHDALVAEAEESALHVVVKPLRRSSWKALVAEHPPRDGHTGDQSIGVNEDEFKDALVTFVNENDPEDRTILEGIDLADLDYLSDIDYDRIYFKAFGLNRGMVDGPKANLVSRMSQENDET